MGRQTNRHIENLLINIYFYSSHRSACDSSDKCSTAASRSIRSVNNKHSASMRFKATESAVFSDPSAPPAKQSRYYAVFHRSKAATSAMESVDTETLSGNSSSLSQTTQNQAIFDKCEALNEFSDSSSFQPRSRNASRNQAVINSLRPRALKSESCVPDAALSESSCQPESESVTESDNFIPSTECTDTDEDSTPDLNVRITKKSKQKNEQKKKASQSFDFNKYVGIIKKWKSPTGIGNRIRCEMCFKYRDTVHMYAISRKNAQITKEEGTGNRTDVLEAHLITPYHIACMERHTQELAHGANIGTDIDDDHVLFEKQLTASNSEKADKISRYMMAIYTDAKLLSPSAYSWPARIFSNEYSRNYSIINPQENQEAMHKINLQYMSPAANSDFLKCIVEVDRNVVAQKLESCLAVSLRVDGSIDRTNIDKIYVLAQTINAAGDKEMLFLGIGEQI